MKTNNCLYIGGGFASHTYPWLIPIIDGFCTEKGISTLIFNNIPLKKLEEFPSLKPILSKYKILNERELIPFWKTFTLYIFTVLNAFLLLLNFRRRDVLNKSKSWYESQILHSILDQENLFHLGSGIPRLFARLWGCVLSVREKHRIEYVLNNFKIDGAFLGHSVYRYRVLLAIFREKNIQVINQAMFNCHLQKINKDIYFASLENKKYDFIKKNIDPKEIESYWNKRLIGEGTYDLANYAQSVKNTNIEFPKNLVFLHIFKDSPFNTIDRDRIFSDYYEWVVETLKILKESNEKWTIKIHPSSYRWGENKNHLIKKLIKKVYKSQNSNIELIQTELTNLDIFRNCNRLVTFSGTCHLEVACHGVKPITIQETQLEEFNKNYVLKPIDLNSYRQMLLEPSNSNSFKLKSNEIEDSRFLLFVREKILTLKENLSQTDVYRGDNISRFASETDKLKKTLPVNIENLTNNGINLAMGFTHCFSKDYQVFAREWAKNNLTK
jgi:hypothetical protein